MQNFDYETNPAPQQPTRLQPQTLLAIAAFEEAAAARKASEEVISATVASVPTDEIFTYLEITDQIQENYK